MIELIHPVQQNKKTNNLETEVISIFELLSQCSVTKYARLENIWKSEYVDCYNSWGLCQAAFLDWFTPPIWSYKSAYGPFYHVIVPWWPHCYMTTYMICTAAVLQTSWV